MCGRFTLIANKSDIEEYFGAQFSDQFEVPIYNAAPSMLLPVITNDKPSCIQFFRWGTYSEINKNQKLIINAKAETLFEKPKFKTAARLNRCIILATGFFEWEKRSGENFPYIFSSDTNKFMCLAGIYFKDSQNKSNNKFVIITMPANKQVALIHSRMPLILNKDEIKYWLTENIDENNMKDFLMSHAIKYLNMKRVSKLVNSSKNNSELIFKPDFEEQGELF